MLNFLQIVFQFLFKNKFFLKFIIVALMMLIAGLFFFRKNEYDKKNYVDFENYVKFLKQKNSTLEICNQQCRNFIINNKNIYGLLIAINLSKNYVQKHQFNHAISLLKLCMNYTKDINLKTIIQIRIIRMQIEQRNIHLAKIFLNSINNSHWKNIIEDINGNLSLLEKNKVSAVNAWKKSLFYQNDQDMKDIIKMKINYVTNNLK